MRVLIDTHTFIWFFSNSARLSSVSRDVIELKSSTTMTSIVSIWEISIKNAKGRLQITDGFQSLPAILANNDIVVLPVEINHTLVHNSLPFHHLDPFDRMIAAQAIFERLDLVSIDDTFDDYFIGTEVKRIW